jgi:hypothetical protein
VVGLQAGGGRLDRGAEHLHRAVRADDERPRRQPQVVEAAGAGPGQRLGRLADDPPHHRRGQRAAADDRLERLARHVLGDDVADVAVAADAEHPDQAHVVDERGAAGGVRDVGGEGVPRAQDADQHAALERRVRRTPEGAVGARLDTLLEPVSPLEHTSVGHAAQSLTSLAKARQEPEGPPSRPPPC